LLISYDFPFFYWKKVDVLVVRTALDEITLSLDQYLTGFFNLIVFFRWTMVADMLASDRSAVQS
jgi:hypothetical protein